MTQGLARVSSFRLYPTFRYAAQTRAEDSRQGASPPHGVQQHLVAQKVCPRRAYQARRRFQALGCRQTVRFRLTASPQWRLRPPRHYHPLALRSVTRSRANDRPPPIASPILFPSILVRRYTRLQCLSARLFLQSRPPYIHLYIPSQNHRPSLRTGKMATLFYPPQSPGA